MCDYCNPKTSHSQPKLAKKRNNVKRPRKKLKYLNPIVEYLKHYIKSNNAKLSRIAEIDDTKILKKLNKPERSFFKWSALRQLMNKKLFYSFEGDRVGKDTQKLSNEITKCQNAQEYIKTFGVYGVFYISGGFLGFKVDPDKIPINIIKTHLQYVRDTRTRRSKFFKMFVKNFFQVHHARKAAHKYTAERSENMQHMTFAIALNREIMIRQRNFRKFMRKKYDQSGELFREFLNIFIISKTTGILRQSLLTCFEDFKDV